MPLVSWTMVPFDMSKGGSVRLRAAGAVGAFGALGGVGGAGACLCIAGLAIAAIAACSSGNNSLSPDGGGTTSGSCNPPQVVGDTDLKDCTGCSSTTTCTSQVPLEACCTWATQPDAKL